MTRSLFIGFLMLLTLPGISQRILVVENLKSLRNIKYYPGDKIMLKIENKSHRLVDEIYDMTDTSLILTVMGEVYLDNITGIYRENWLVQTTRGLSFLAGVFYFGIDSFNRLINNNSPVILVETAVISAGFIALAAALTPLRYRKYNTTGNWKLRTIDLDSF